MIKVEIDYTKEEMERFFRFQLMIKDKLRYFYIGVSFLFGLLAMYFLLWGQKFFLGISLIIFAIITLISFPIQTKKTIKKQIASRYTRPKQELSLTEEEIIHYTDKGIIKYTWSEVLEICEIKDCFYLYLSKTKALIINKQKFILGLEADLIKLFKQKNKKIYFYKHF